jgi:uncharacterized protein (TIGR02301 family)
MPRLLMRVPIAVALALGCCSGFCGGPAAAQIFQNPFGFGQEQQPPARPRPPGPPRAKAAPQPEAPPVEVTTPYDPDLQRLAEILGALHFLRSICGSDEGQKWRNEAQSLIDAEAPSGKRHDQMVQSFNRGYLGFRQSYRTCTPAARIIIRRYLEEGAQIARDVTARYAN